MAPIIQSVRPQQFLIRRKAGFIARGTRNGWRFVRFAAAVCVAALTPATYTRAVRAALAQAVCHAAWQPLSGYAFLSLLLGVVITHVVTVTAASYGLSHLALEAVARVIVVELIPLAAALFVALRSGGELLERLAAQRMGGVERGDRWLFDLHVLPGVVANLFAVILLTLVSGMLVLGAAYPVIYGLTPWGLADYTRLVGQVFDPVTAPGLLLKILLFGVAVGIAPATVVLDAPREIAGGGALRAMARLLLALALIEGAALMLLHAWS